MRRPTVLLVSYHYLPAATPGSRRLDTMARLLCDRGWDTIVLTATPAHPGATDAPGVEVIRTTPPLGTPAAAGETAIASPRVSRIPFLGKVAGFPDKYAPWGASLTPALLRLLRARPIDVVLSSSPPHSLHLAVAAARAVRAFPWVAEFRDPWTFPSRRSLPASSLGVQRRVERFVLARADLVIANTPGNRDALLSANPHLEPTRLRVSTNGYDAALFAPGSFPAQPAESADFTYVGEIYAGMLDHYCAALASIRARNPALVPRLAVYGTIDAAERRRIAALGLETFIEDRGFVSHEASIAAMKNARALLALLPLEARWRTCVPSKVYWYLAARRPILAIVPDGDAAHLVREMKAGSALVSGDPEVAGREIEAFVSAARAGSDERHSRSDIDRYSMNHIVDGIDAILREVIDGNPA